MRRAWTARWICLLAGCGPGQTHDERAVHPVSEAEVVARVNGAPIAREDVRTLVAAGSVSAREALRLLVDAELLVQHAEALGYGDTEAVGREARAAAVRVLLARATEGADTVEAQRERYRALLRQLEAQSAVRIDEASVSKALGDPELWRLAGSR